MKKDNNFHSVPDENVLKLYHDEEDDHPPTRDCGCEICRMSFDLDEVPDGYFYSRKFPND